MTCEQWAVVAVPFPFTDRAAQKRRPALVISPRAFNRHGHTVMAMITSAPADWPGDTVLKDFAAAGLSRPCLVRLKLFTLDNRLIVRSIGKLAEADRRHAAAAFADHLRVRK